MTDINQFVGGFRTFKATTFSRQKDIVHHLLQQGHKPSTLVISCSDIRISPSEIFAVTPGEFFNLSNIGGLVPKFSVDGIHGILSAIEYAVTVLEVQNILVLGHAKCDSIKMIMSDKFVAEKNGLSESMKKWLSIATEAREAVKSKMQGKSEEEQQTACEQESIVISLKNLLTYPYIAKRVKEDKLKILGWQFDIENGDVLAFNGATGIFESIS